jgi:hypothetical protein
MKTNTDRANAEAERRAAIEQHACGQSPPMTLAEQRQHIKAALDREVAKPLHKQQGTVIADLRHRLRDVDKNIAAAS